MFSFVAKHRYMYYCWICEENANRSLYHNIMICFANTEFLVYITQATTPECFVKVRFADEFDIPCHDGTCIHSVEIKHKNDKTLTGPRLAYLAYVTHAYKVIGHSLSAHCFNTLFQHTVLNTLSANSFNTLFWYTLSVHSFSTLYQHTLSAHSYSTLFQHTL